MLHCTDCKWYQADWERQVLAHHKCTNLELNSKFAASWAVTGDPNHMLTAITARQYEGMCGMEAKYFRKIGDQRADNIRRLQPVAAARDSEAESS